MWWQYRDCAKITATIVHSRKKSQLNQAHNNHTGNWLRCLENSQMNHKSANFTKNWCYMIMELLHTLQIMVVSHWHICICSLPITTADKNFSKSHVYNSAAWRFHFERAVIVSMYSLILCKFRHWFINCTLTIFLFDVFFHDVWMCLISMNTIVLLTVEYMQSKINQWLSRWRMQ